MPLLHISPILYTSMLLPKSNAVGCCSRRDVRELTSLAVARETCHDKPLEHTLVWQRQHGVKDIAINLHYCPEVILNRFGEGAALVPFAS
jgi:hypothetical protein